MTLQERIEKDLKIEEAISFLVTEYAKSGHNTKPVVIHSIKVAMTLYDLGYKTEMVIAGVLHDLLEDSEVTKDEIAAKFGEVVAEMVEGLSFRSEIEDKVAQYREMFERTLSGGKDLLIIKSADTYQNSFFVGDKLKKDDFFLRKMEYFLEISQPMIGEEKIWKMLNERFADLSTRVVEE